MGIVILMVCDLFFLFFELMLVFIVVLMLVVEMLCVFCLVLVFGLIGLGLFIVLIFLLLEVDISVFGGIYCVDLLFGWVKLILLLGIVLVFLMMWVEIVGKDREGSVYVLLCLVMLGVLMLVGGGDMMLLVLGVVLMGFGFFVMVVWLCNDVVIEVVMKYLVFGVVIGLVMIYGLIFWFGGVGLMFFFEFGVFDGKLLIVLVGLVVVLIGLGYKVVLVLF